jgi:hypothetical protein
VDSFSIWHWIVVLIYIAMIVLYFVSAVRILNRTGYSGFWSLIGLVPLLNIIMLWQFSKAEWPALRPQNQA